MKDIKSNILIILVCIILGVILAIQLKSVENNIGSSTIPTQRAQQLAIDYKKIQDERDRIRNELDNLEAKLKQYEKGEAEKDVYLENLYKDIEKYRVLAGYESVQGPGIVIEINDPPMEVLYGEDSSAIVDNYEFLLQIISVINATEAEAISINEQRYTSFTEIVPAAKHLEINGVSFGPPFVIKAIGKPDDLENALRIKRGIIWRMENLLNLDIHIKQEQNIVIPKYRKIKEFRYAKPLEEISN
ncbi:Uncharacterized conserved protein YlxW, UPF0749 family [Proteiniborus ethanoligenes]|uniref:Uncharacterized conserved protein YlxW, UPF0749 family n=1 Tax=Proteiniborus ethanoligenes TaxID=415015 RepID=A0A1H3JY79_9FIRM|nr:DUF881 domain-containing protein [Proteiniborus ethanoligenes]SDY44268.1 Uncharacterized conserved protein YlxW, UPF0749 family [Proteiniborus ethanoligenes]